MIKKFFIPLLFFFSISLYSGFTPETLVYTVDGAQWINSIKAGQSLVTSTESCDLSASEIIATKRMVANQYVEIIVGDQRLRCSLQQQFYVTSRGDWIEAQDLQVGDELLTASEQTVVVQSIRKIRGYRVLYDVSLQEYHIFLVTDAKILAHNIFVSAGILFLIGDGAIVYESAYVAFGVVAAVWAGLKHCGSSKQKTAFIEPMNDGCNHPQTGFQKPQSRGRCGYSQSQPDYYDQEGYYCVIDGSGDKSSSQRQCGYSKNQQQHPVAQSNNRYQATVTSLHRTYPGGCLIDPTKHLPGKSCGAKNCKPRKGPYGYHIPSPKHPPNPKGSASPGLNTEEGQDALDVSVPVKDKGKSKKSRVTVWGGKYIVFQPTTKDPEVWHNYMPEWDDLTDVQQNILIKAGLVKDKKSGKIIKDMKKQKSHKQK